MGSVDTDVLTCTGSGGVVHGRLSGVAAFKRAAGQKEFQQLLTMSLNRGSFHDGDCGSWVCDTRTGAVYGHIVSGYPGTGSAYLMPSEEIFQDMQRTLGKSVQLLTRTLAARNAALAIWGHIDFETTSPVDPKPVEDRPGLEASPNTTSAISANNPPDLGAKRPIRRERTMKSIKSLATKARTLTIGKARAERDMCDEAELRQESYPTYLLRWDEKLKPFLVAKFPELKERYKGRDVSKDNYWFAIPDSLTDDEVEQLKKEISKLKDKKKLIASN